MALDLFCVLTALAAMSHVAPTDRAALRYDLKVGDRLVFRSTLDQEIEWPGRSQSIRVDWSTHVLVVAKERDAWLVGFARNRTRAELLRSVENEHDSLAKDRPRFEERIGRIPARFFDANRIDAYGVPRFPMSAVREWPSETILETRELPALPTIGMEMRGSLLGMRWSVFEQEEHGGERRSRVEARGEPASVLRYWFDPLISLPRRVEFSTEYSAPPKTRYRERWTTTLIEQRREQSLALWLWDPETRLGALEALRHAEEAHIDPQRLVGLPESGDRVALRLALSLAYRFGQAPFSAEALATVVGDGDPRLRALAVRALDGSATSAGRALIKRALADDDFAVRAAAASWLRRRRSLPGKGAVDAPVLDTGDRDARAPRPADTHLATRKPAQHFGTRVHSLAHDGFQGWPYIVHVPDEYRGDEPLPLLIHMSGGSGRALSGMLASREVIANTGWLMVFPQARGMWWHETTTDMMEALLVTLGGQFNIDWNRVYLAGVSNGASGAFYYATLWPHRIAAVVSMMGAGALVPGIVRAPAENAALVPMLFLHGDRDEVVPVQAAHATVATLKRVDRDAPVKLRVLRGRGHDVVLDRCAGLALRFLAEHVRDPFPRCVRLRLRELRHPRRYWIEVVEKSGKEAVVEAKISAGNSVRISCRNVLRMRLLARRELLTDPGPVRVSVGRRKVFEGSLPEVEEVHEAKRRTGDPYLDVFSPIEIDLTRESR